MTKAPIQRRILLIDDHQDLLELMKFRIELEFDAEVVTASSGNLAIEELKKDSRFVCVLSDYFMKGGNGAKVYQYMIDNKIEVPFILVSSAPPYEYPEFRGKETAGYLVKPNLDKLERTIEKIIGSDCLNTSPYVPVPLGVLRKLGKLSFDCHLKIDDKYITVLDKETEFEKKDYVKYKDKGISSFLVKREDSKDLLTHLHMTISSNDKADVDSTIDIVGTTLNIAKSIIQLGDNEAEISKAIEKSAEALSKAVGLDLKLASYLERLEVHGDDYLGQHSSLLAYISCLIANQLTWESDFTHIKLTYASLLHDLSLTDEEIIHHDYFIDSSMDKSLDNDEKVKDFKEHPINSAKILRQFSSLPASIDQIITQHHERPDGSGFPSGLKASQISPLSCIFIVAEDFTDYIIKQKSIGKSIDYENYIKISVDKFSQGNFKDAFKALIKALSLVSKTDKAA